MGKNTPLWLEDSEGIFHDLITISSGKISRRKTIDNIKTNLEAWMKNQHFDHYRNALLDVAIVLFIGTQRMKRQDVDNVAKIVLDALKKDDKTKYRREAYLFDDDSQVVRLLVYKIPRCEDEVYNTDSMTISFRVHDPQKQMLLTAELSPPLSSNRKWHSR